MARQAEADGIELVCATPHIHPDHDVRVEELEGRVDAVNDTLELEGIATRVMLGGEIAEVQVERLDDEFLRCVSLGRGQRWLLIEPRPGPLADSLLETVERLGARGFGSVIAHPERHAAGDFFERLAALVERGALIQVTAALLATGPASPTLIDVAGRGLLHLLGSDAHSSHGGRPLRLSEGFARLREVDYLQAHLDWIREDGPRAIVNGQAVTPPFAPI
jgi:tyrosine-protein phosphatase YwqE